MGQIIAVFPAVEGELQHLHAREAGFLQERPHTGRNDAQILGDDLEMSELRPDRVEEIHPRSVDPLSGKRGLRIRGDRVVFVEAPEMVHADHIVEAVGALHAGDPPLIAGLPVIGPVVEGIAPELAGRGKGVRRASRHRLRIVVLVELEEFRTGPGVRAVKSHIDRDIADDADPLFVRVGVELLPLLREFVLLEAEEIDLVFQHLPHRVERLLVAVPVGEIPVRPALPLKMLLERHEEAVIIQPAGLFLPERLIIRVFRRRLLKTFIGQGQHRKAVLVQRAVIHGFRIRAEIPAVALPSLQEPLFDQGLQVDKIGISREGREGLVGRIAVAGRSEGQHLPVGLSRLLQKIHKFIGFF